MTIILRYIIVALAAIIFLLICMAISATIVGAIGAIFLARPWSFGYHRSWERWGWLVFFWLFVFAGSIGSKNR